ncbi:hypothetical protein AnigIFM63326_004985 [Aspergillus niger]|nr:hypothetical protein AnigIFM63326_004985 [Aspergillus niger]
MQASRGSYKPLVDEDLQTSGDARPKTLSKQSWLMHGTLLLFSLSLFILSLMIAPAPSPCTEMAWSPVVDAVDVKPTRYNVTFGIPSRYPSRFIDTPGADAVDAEWELFTKNPLLDGRQGTLAVDRDTVKRLPLASNPEWLNSLIPVRDGDQGQIKYMATLELFHHLHCLNMLRKASHSNYYSVADLNNQMLRGHLDHCTETLREVLMCNAGVGLIMFHWVEGLDDPYPDYNTYHQCRDYDAVLDWALKNTVPLRSPVSRKPEDYATNEPLF